MKNKDHKGSIGFDRFYRNIFSDRWDGLQEALLKEKKSVAVFSPGKKPTVDCQVFEEGALYPNTFIQNSRWDPAVNGEYYLLDGASLLPVSSLIKTENFIRDDIKILDMCAAPGGKSVLLSWALEGRGVLTSNDLSKIRASRLRRVLDEYVSSDWMRNSRVTKFDGSKWCLYEKNVFDLILLDAPCSSERHVLASSEHLSQWSPKRSKYLAARQWSLLASALELLKPGGTLVYSTCALSPLENDGVIEKMFKKRKGQVELIKSSWPFGEESEFGWSVFPDKTPWGPFYLSTIKKL